VSARERVTLLREVEGTLIPSGSPIPLAEGSDVVITQSLGGTYTVTTDQGVLVRIDGEDADALGKGPTAPPSSGSAAGDGSPRSVEEAVWEQLRTCYDPEIPVDIVELGLVYHCAAQPLPGGGDRVEVKFTLTAPGCGMGDVLKADVVRKIQRLPNVAEVDVEVVFQPQWNPNMMSEAARLQLGMM
jgi:probable FeS assembly SUF system protein SufT